ncbi:uncharacterized protein EDB93DRAFT_1256491 [Suillus bovinus]|uniref:uncharacterized protein n=1 Tax=Suillus bovinus TaxID=48563 RepID=UPI001B8868AD|nr:uncharacterized protein EDB93DRAFT_1256491 [Suillus bovinus]KAG2128908.1 hypothetical protein EDB93DRAFT_1256491 [Suillus bovinus]
MAHSSTLHIPHMGPPASIRNNIPPSPSVNIEGIHYISPSSAGLSYMGYYVGRVTRIIWKYVTVICASPTTLLTPYLIFLASHRKTTFYIAQGRAIRHIVVLYTNLEDLIAKNNHRYEEQEESTREQDRLQYGYILLTQVLPWLHEKLAELDVDDCEDMKKKLKRGADAARGDDTSTLKDLVATWLNEDFHPSQLL